MLTLVNLTPHELCFYFRTADDTEVAAAWPSTGTVRVREVTEEAPAPHVEWPHSAPGTSSCVLPTVRKSYAAVEGLPAPEEGTIFVVSLVALQALAGSRSDVYAPDTGPDSAVRDGSGKILGIRRLMQY